MPQSELLFFILIDSFTSNLAFITNSELAIWVALQLSAVPKILIVAAAFVGVICANFANYFLGRIVRNIFVNKISKGSESKENIGVLRSIYNNFGIYLLVLGFIPVYSKFVVFFGGFTKYRMIRVVFIVALAKACYYYYG